MAEPSRTEYSLAMIMPHDPVPLSLSLLLRFPPQPPPLTSPDRTLSSLLLLTLFISRLLCVCLSLLSLIPLALPILQRDCKRSVRVCARGRYPFPVDKTVRRDARRFEYGADYYSESIALQPTARGGEPGRESNSITLSHNSGVEGRWPRSPQGECDCGASQIGRAHV